MNIFITPCTSIIHLSHIDDAAETLFFMHSVFRIGTVQQIATGDVFHHAILPQLTADDDPQLRVLKEHIQGEVAGDTRRDSVGNRLLQPHRAEELCTSLLKQTSEKTDKPYYYHRLGLFKADYITALEYYEKALETRRKSIPSNHPDLATSCNNNNIG
ncbi:unnamed protein product [Adineta ricciae]|uniref:Uncharacterized protein n=1 Tax=Adineta ricciae TaxID=249248 RepID=A0A814DSY6_ADIRI|nr:unnamed protein product [Adineta ricciae]CAF0995947.1 unnamed protein product [Adineta ricciae]